MNYYLKRRLQSGLTKNDVARELGLDYIRYSAIERGVVKMPLNLIDKFNEIINRGKENEIARTENEIRADEFWQEISQLTENNNYVLKEKMNEFNITSLNQLANLLGYKSVGTIYNYLEGRNPVGVEFKKRIYNFFSNEKNIQIPTKVVGKSETGKKRIVEKAVDPKLDKYYEKTNFRKILQDYNITNRQIAKVVGAHDSTISNMTRKSSKPSYKIIQQVKDYLESIINDNKEIVEPKSVDINNDYISRQKLIDNCDKELLEINAKIEELQKQLAELNSKVELTNKIKQFIANI